MPEQVGRCDDQAISFGVRGFESGEGPDVLCSDAAASSVPLSFAVPNLFVIIENYVVCDFGIFRVTVCDEQAVLLAMSGFVDRGVTGVREDGGELLKLINFLCGQSDER